jgi:hypothetical protein
MEVPMKYIWFLVLFITLGIAGIDGVYGAGECGNSSPDKEASKLAACAAAAQYPKAKVSHRCCSQVEKIGQNPKCLCALLFSNSAKSAEIQPEVAVTVPKRCNIANRPVGYQCGGQFLHVISISLTLFFSVVLPCSFNMELQWLLRSSHLKTINLFCFAAYTFA